MLISYNTDLLPHVRMLGHIRYSEPWVHFARTINEYILYVIRDGNMYIRENGMEYHLKSGDFFLLEPSLPHEGYRKASCDYYYAHFTHPDMMRVDDEEKAMAELAEKRRKTLISYNLDVENPTDPISYLPKHFHLPGNEYRTVLHSAADCYDGREEHYRQRTATILHGFLLNTAHEHLMNNCTERKKIKKSEVVAEQIIRYLNQNYSKPLNSRMITELFEVNYDYINRVVSQMTGYTIFSYLNALRINNAKQLIATTDLPFSEGAYLVGIEDRYYFSKLFHRMTGMTPTEYYKEARR